MHNPFELISNSNDVTHWNETFSMDQNLMEVETEEDLPPSVTFTLIVIGTFGNILVCLAILLDRKLQNLTNYFLLSLAFTDLLVSILILPARLAVVRYRFQPSTFPLCFLYLVGDDFITAASAIHICFISIERYFSLKNPLLQRNLTKRGVAMKISLVWLIAFVSVIPYMVIAIITKHPYEPMFCSDLLANFRHFEAIVLMEIFVIVVMVIVVIISFAMTVYLLKKLARKQQINIPDDVGLVETLDGNQIEDTTKNKNASTTPQSNEITLRMVWLVSFTFIIGMVPYTSTSLFYICFPDIIIPPILLEITAYLLYANSVINPFVYTLFHKTFRRDFKKLILFQCKEINNLKSK